MASLGKMRRVHEIWVDSPLSPRAAQVDWEQAAMDMDHMRGARATQRYSHAPRYSYRDDVGPGTGQIKDHKLHDQYFGPPTRFEAPLPANGDGVQGGNTGYGQDTKEEPLNLLHSPVDTKAPFDTILAPGASYYGDKKDGHQDWL
jgi:hypothetical protein